MALSADTAFPLLFSPVKLGGMELCNRGVMGAMHTRLETLDSPHERIFAFYRERALGGIGLILTGGFSPNAEGRLDEEGPVVAVHDEGEHEAILRATEGTPTKACLQILHAGRYAKHAQAVGPSSQKARINAFAPRALETDEVWRTIDDFIAAARRAKQYGYAGVEIMGSEGYLINQFTSPATNTRTDTFGGDRDGRFKLPLEIVSRIRSAVGPDFAIIYRISAVDLVPSGSGGDETLALVRQVAESGADAINTGVGWHESRIPTIAHSVPRNAWIYATERLKSAVEIPVIASNRINDPAFAEKILQDQSADLVSLARPLLADPAFMAKARSGRVDEINPCIACNQACLDRIFRNQSASCLVNPKAGREIEFSSPSKRGAEKIAVVGAGPAGLAFASEAAARGHGVVLYEARPFLGGQLEMARVVPGKAEFNALLRYFNARLAQGGVKVRLSEAASSAELEALAPDRIVLATGVKPRDLALCASQSVQVLSYQDVLLYRRAVGERVALVGAGPIAFDVAEYLLFDGQSSLNIAAFAEEYGLDLSLAERGGLRLPRHVAPVRSITMMQRGPGKIGADLGVSTGWIKRDRLREMNVEMLNGVAYDAVDERGLHITHGGAKRLIAADTVVICAGQVAERALFSELETSGCAIPIHVIGGARDAASIDAMRAIDDAVRLAHML